MLFKVKVWMLNLKPMDAVEGTAFSAWMTEQKADSGLNIDYSNHYDYYKVFEDSPIYHMMYSISYLQSTSIIRLLMQHQRWAGIFRRAYLMERDAQ